MRYSLIMDIGELLKQHSEYDVGKVNDERVRLVRRDFIRVAIGGTQTRYSEWQVYMGYLEMHRQVFEKERAFPTIQEAFAYATNFDVLREFFEKRKKIGE